MPRALLAAATAVLAAAAVAGAAPARGLTFTDPVGDANFLDGRTAVGSQPGLDVVRVTLAPAERTRRTSGITVRIDLAGPALTAPGTTYYFTADQDGCNVRVDLARGAQGWGSMYSRYCSTGLGAGDYTGGTIVAPAAPNGTSVTFVVPADALRDSRIGAPLTGIHAGSALRDPVFHGVGPHPDVASYSGTYAVGS